MKATEKLARRLGSGEAQLTMCGLPPVIYSIVKEEGIIW